MKLNKLHLDHISFDYLCYLGVKEGLIVKDFKGDTPKDWHKEYRNVQNRAELLLYLTLYNEIDCWDTLFDMQYFIDEGIVSKDSNMLNFDSTYRRRYGETEFKKLEEQDKELALYSWKLSEMILTGNIRKLSNYYLKNKHIIHPNIGKYDVMPAKKDLNKYIKIALGQIDGQIPHTNFNSEMESQISFLEESLSSAIFYSIKENQSFTSILNLKENSVAEQKINEDYYYIVRTKLKEEALIFPYPRTLKDAVEIRSKKEMIRFRKLLSLWLKALQDGENNLETAIRKDIRKANKELKNLKSWREYKESPINFWINSIGGHIPILSNVLTVVGMVGGLYEGYVEKNYQWIKLMKTTANKS